MEKNKQRAAEQPAKLQDGKQVKISLRLLHAGEEELVAELVTKVFLNSLASLRQTKGAAEFLQFIKPAAVQERILQGNFLLLAVAGNEIIGMIEVRACRHIVSLFVAEKWQRQGVGRKLLRRALLYCLQQKPALTQLTVNAVAVSALAYKRMGFNAFAGEVERLGIDYIPMVFNIPKKDRGIRKCLF